MNIIEWRNFLAESNLTYKAKLTGLVLSLFYRKDRATYPSITTLSNMTSLTVNPVQAGLDELELNGFIKRKKERMKGNKFTSYVYEFTYQEKLHVSRGDTSYDTSNDISYDTSNDISYDISRGDKEVEEIDKIERSREALSIFKNKKLNRDMKKFAEDNGVFGSHLEKSWQRFLIKKGDAMLESCCSYEEFFSSWQLWILGENPPQAVESVNSPQSEPLKGKDLKIHRLGLAAFNRDKKLGYYPEEIRILENYESKNGKVWWYNIKQYQEGKE